MRNVISTITLTALCGALTLAGACSPFDPDYQSEEPFRCGTSDPKCPDGFTCQPHPEISQGVCTSGEVASPDAGPNQPDAVAFACNDDSLTEPNETAGAAYDTGLTGANGLQKAIPNLAICPGGDVDVFHIQNNMSGRTIRAQVGIVEPRTTDRLRLDIRDENDTPLKNGTYQNDLVLLAELPDAAEGDYYIRVEGATVGSRNNYVLTVSLLGP